MAEIGRINRLVVTKIMDDGVHLDGGGSGEIILSDRGAIAKCRPGDELDVFVYVDRDRTLLATTRKPLIAVGEFGALQVVANSPAGAYLDWGMPRDLLVPKREQREEMEEGRSYVVFAFLDEQGKRVTASSKLDKFLDLRPPPYLEGEEVDLVVYGKTDLGYKAIVNHAHWGMIYKNEVFQELTTGQQLKGYIKKIREDLKIDLSLQQSGYQGVDPVAQNILETIKDHGGLIGITDKSPPEVIYAQFGISKKIFKKAIGALYKKRLITIEAGGVKLAG